MQSPAMETASARAKPLFMATSLAVIAVTALSPCIGNAVERETIATITKMYSYVAFGGGDIVLEVTTPVAGCPQGFWLSPSDPGSKTTYALLLSAYHAGTTVRFGGEDTQLWTGSGSTYCRLKFAALL